MDTTALDYFLLVTLGCLGTIQIAAANARLKGLSFFKKRLVGYIFGALVAIGAFGWFFAVENRNTPSVIEGAQQVGMFLAGAIAAYIITSAVSSLLKYRLYLESTDSHYGEQNNSGIEMFKETTLLGAIRTILKRKQEDQ